MTTLAETVTRTPAEAEVIARAEAALAAVDSGTFPWPSEGGRWITDYAQWLADDLEAREDLLAGRIHPASEFPELARWWPDDALGQAVEKIVQDIAAGTEALVERVRRYCGDEGAEFVLERISEGGARS